MGRTVLLAPALLAERLAGMQLAGLGVAAVAVSLLAVGEDGSAPARHGERTQLRAPSAA